MTSIHPLISPLWFPYVLGVLIAQVLPGYFLVARPFLNTDRLTTLYVSWASGTLLVPIVGMVFGWAHIPLHPISYLLLMTAGVVVMRWRRVDLPAKSEKTGFNSVEVALLLAIGLGVAACAIWPFRQWVVPTHVHDATNHSFMTMRIVETSSTRLDRIFGPPWGSPTAAYLVGWHASAALIARLTGLAPYIATWYAPFVALGMFPIGAAILWRRFGLSRWSYLGGAVFLLSSKEFPLGALSWGGFGSLVGIGLAPFVALMLLEAIARSRWTTAVGAALAVAGLIQVHASSAVGALLLCCVGVPSQLRTTGRHIGRFGVLAFVLTLVVFGGIENFRLARDYSNSRMAPPARELISTRVAMRENLEALGEGEIQRGLAIAAIITALLLPGTRPVAIGSLGLTLLFLTMSSLRDPVTQIVSQIFYQQASRVRALQVLVLPPLVLVPLELVRTHRGVARIPRWLALVIAAGIAYVCVVPGVKAYWRRIGNGDVRAGAPFSADDCEMARKIASVVPPDAWIANYWDDGSAWAMQISRRRFVIPNGWIMGGKEDVYYRRTITHLLENPWPEDVERLKSLGVQYLYVSDQHWKSKPEHPFVRSSFDGDPRFRELLRGKDSSLYALDWESRAATRLKVQEASIQYESGWGPRESWGRWIMDPTATFSLAVPDSAEKLRIWVAPFPGQLDEQELRLLQGAEEIASMTLDGEPWEWKAFDVRIPERWLGNSVQLQLSCSKQWMAEEKNPRLRAVPVRRMELFVRGPD